MITILAVLLCSNQARNMLYYTNRTIFRCVKKLLRTVLMTIIQLTVLATVLETAILSIFITILERTANIYLAIVNRNYHQVISLLLKVVIAYIRVIQRALILVVALNITLLQIIINIFMPHFRGN